MKISTKRVFTSSEIHYFSLLISAMLIFSLLCSCSTDENTTTEVPPTYVLTPGETLYSLTGSKDHELGELEIYVGSTISQEEYTDKEGNLKERETAQFRVVYLKLEEPIVWIDNIHEGQVLEFGEYWLRVIEIRIRDSDQSPVVEVAIWEP